MSGDNSDATFKFVSPIFIACGGVSIMMTWLMSLMYKWNAHVRDDHSSTLIQLITVSEAFYSLKFFVSSAVFMGGLKNGRDSFHFISDNCATAVAYGQFTGTAAISWNACWMIDILVTLFLPLRNTSTLMRWYHVFVWGLSISTTLMVILGAGHEASDAHTCWLRGDGGFSYTFEIPLFFIMALALFSLIMVSWRLRGGGLATRRLRNGVLLRHVLYVVAFVCLWLFPILHSFLDSEGTVKTFSILDAIAVSSQAAVSVSIRLSEPGAMRIFASTMRRLRNTLASYLCLGRYFSPIYSSNLGESITSVGNEFDEGAVFSESPVPFLALIPCICIKVTDHPAPPGTPLSTERMDSERSVDKANNHGKGRGWVSTTLSFFSSSLEAGGMHRELVHAGSPLLNHSYLASGAQARLPGPNGMSSSGSGTWNGSAQASSRGGVGGVSSNHSDHLSPLSQSPRPDSTAAASSSSFGFGSASDSPISPKGDHALTPNSGEGWADMSAELRQEMGIALLMGLVQAVRAAEVSGRKANSAQESISSSSEAVQDVVLVEEETEEEEGGEETMEEEEVEEEGDLSDESGEILEETAGDKVKEGTDNVKTPPPLKAAVKTSRSNATPANNHPKKNSSLIRDKSTMVLQGPCAPAQRRSIRNILNDPSTKTRKFQSINSRSITVSSLEESAFTGIREAAGVDAESVFSQLNPVLLAEGKLKTHFSAGSSSSFFCRGLSETLVVKTITGGEAEVLLRLLPAFTRHLAENPASLLCRYYGAFSVTIPSVSRVFFVLMSNVHPVSGIVPTGTLTFDLKGSTINRRARVSREENGASKTLYQDMEFREGLPRGVPLVDPDTLLAGRASLSWGSNSFTSVAASPRVPSSLALGEFSSSSSGGGGGGGGGGSSEETGNTVNDSMPAAAFWGGLAEDLQVGSTRGRKLVDQLARDVTLLASQGLMDYSLLLQIVPIVVGEGEERKLGLGVDDYTTTTTTTTTTSDAVEGKSHHHRHHHRHPQTGGVATTDTLCFPPPPTKLTISTAVSLVKAAGDPVYRSLKSASSPAKLPSETTRAAFHHHSLPELPQWSPLSVSLCALGVDKSAVTAAAAASSYLSQGGDLTVEGDANAAILSSPPSPPFSWQSSPPNSERGGGGSNNFLSSLVSASPRALIQVGVVDMLQYYNVTKKAENALKSVQYGLKYGISSTGPNISAVEPMTYAVRFMDFATSLFQSQ